MKKLIAHRRTRKTSLSSAPLSSPAPSDNASETFKATLLLFQKVWNLEDLPTESELEKLEQDHQKLKDKVNGEMPISTALLHWMTDKFELIRVVHQNPDLLTVIGDKRADAEFDPIKTHNVWIKLNHYVGNEKNSWLNVLPNGLL